MNVGSNKMIRGPSLVNNEKVKLCELCEEKPATILCSECPKCYCTDCSQYIHGKASKKGHKVVNIQEGIVVNVMCPIHKDCPLDRFNVYGVQLRCAKCVGIQFIDTDYNLLKLNKDNETFSASGIRNNFIESMKSGSKMIEEIKSKINGIENTGKSVKKKIEQTYERLREILDNEEKKILKELENICNTSKKELNDNLDNISKIYNYDKILDKAYINNQRGDNNRFMELTIVSEMEKQRRETEKLQKTMMTDLVFGWDSTKRKLSYAKGLFNGAPVPFNISFSDVFCRSATISWDCDESLIKKEDEAKIKYVVEISESYCDSWKEVYSGRNKTCSIKGLVESNRYDVRIKCTIGNLQGEWSFPASFITKNIINSVIISQEQNSRFCFNELCKWIGPAHFELLYRGTRDGFKASDFHSKCDGQEETLVLIKNRSGHIFGGYSSIPWESLQTGYKQTESFLFTLTNMYGTSPTFFDPKNENDGHAVFHGKAYGPTFGGGHDIFISSDCNTNMLSYANFNTYSNTTGKGNSIFSSNPNDNHFQVQEIEVFKIVLEK